MKKEEKSIKELVDSILESDELFLVDVSVSGVKGASKVKVLIDGDKGFDIDACAQVSRSLSEALENKNLMEGKYILEVSSPGVDFPLKFRRQYIKNKGRKLRITLQNNKEVQGKLIDVKEESLLIAAEKKEKKKAVLNEMDIPFENIKESKVIILFK
ncbi:MAG: ribosome maturation factor RimP [Candidatus Cyclobacteriaceae bacterium M3_2C_046]